MYLELVEREVAQACVHPGEVAGLDGVQHLRGGAEGQGLEVVVLGQLVLLQAVVHRGQAVVGRPLVHAHPWGGRGSTRRVVRLMVRFIYLGSRTSEEIA